MTQQRKSLGVIADASSSIGGACAHLFSEVEYSLLLLSRHLERIQQLELSQTLCVQIDVTDMELMKEAVWQAI